ncbi:MAG: FtsB family cell division protein [Patescibacteria group bacterium]
MQRHKIHPRVLSAGDLPRPNNFFYRLFSSQRFLAIVGLVFLFLIVFPLAKTYTQRRLVESEIDGVKKEISDFEKTNKDLKEMITYLESDQSLEESARLNLNLKKPGEKVIVIDNSKNASSSEDLNKTTNLESNFLKWWHYFFAKN